MHSPLILQSILKMEREMHWNGRQHLQWSYHQETDHPYSNTVPHGLGNWCSLHDFPCREREIKPLCLRDDLDLTEYELPDQTRFRSVGCRCAALMMEMSGWTESNLILLFTTHVLSVWNLFLLSSCHYDANIKQSKIWRFYPWESMTFQYLFF